MAKTTRLFGIILTLIGIIGYVASGAASITALIPAFFGVVFILLGRLAEKESIRKHVMHVAVLLALIGLFGSFTGLLQLGGLLTGSTEAPAMAVLVRSLMALLCIGYIGLAVKSFIDARKAA
ncbi:hypothetical protein QA596_10340 [Balneolales bacterium ANBcel1]|nr:hypothetical protein [Balneolales bacterium ANBcel1]